MMDLIDLSDSDIEALLKGQAAGEAADVRLLVSCLSELRAEYGASDPLFVGKELAALLTDGLPGPAPDRVARRSKVPTSRETLRTWWRRASLRLGVGAVGLVGFCAGMGAANALPSPAQLVVAHVAHVFSIEMPSPESDRPSTVQPAPSATVTPTTAAVPEVRAVDSARERRTPDATPSSVSASSSRSAGVRQSSGSRRGGSGSAGGNGSATTSGDARQSEGTSSPEPNGANDVRRADDAAQGTSAGTEAEVRHAADAGTTPTTEIGGGRPSSSSGAGGATGSSGGSGSSSGGR